MVGATSLRDVVAGWAAHVPRVARTARYGAIGLAVGLIGTVAWVLSTQRLYRSEAVLVFDRGAQASALGRDIESTRVLGARLADMVSSRVRIEALIKEVDLYPRVVDRRGVVEAVEEMRRRLRVNQSEGYTYRIWYDGETREQAKDALDRLLASVVKEDSQRRVREAEDAKRFLDAERKQADEDLRAKDSALSSFLIKHPQLASETGASAGGVLRAERTGAASGSELASLELQAAQIEADIAAASARPGVVRNPSGATVDPQLVAARLRAEGELHAAQTDLADKQARLTNEHPDVKRALRRVTDAEGTLRRAEAAVAAWMPPPAPEAPAVEQNDGTAARVTALRHALSAVKQQLATARGRNAPRPDAQRSASTTVAIETEWTRLNREMSEARERQSQLETKQFQAQLAATLAAGGQAGQLTIVDPPFKPLRPVAGERFKIALVGAVGSVVLGLLVIGVASSLDDRLYAARDVGKILDDGIIVVIPKTRARLTARAPEPAAPATPPTKDG